MVYVLKCLIDPDIPVNDGFYRLIDIRRPRPLGAFSAASRRGGRGLEIAISSKICCSRRWPLRCPTAWWAGTKGCVCNIAFGGINPVNKEYFTYYETIAGGFGATLTTDGMDAVQAHFQNTENAPVEETEANYPVRILCYALIENSVIAAGAVAAPYRYADVLSFEHGGHDRQGRPDPGRPADGSPPRWRWVHRR